MATKSRDTLKSDLNTSFPDNNTELITPQVLRDQQTDIIDSLNSSVIRDVSVSGNSAINDDLIYCDGTLTMTLIDPSTAIKPVTITNISGVTTLASAAGTLAVTTLNVAESVTLGPRSGGWVII